MNELGFRSVEYTKMTVWDSVLWQINIHMGKKWPEPSIEQSLKSNIRFRSVFNFFLHWTTSWQSKDNCWRWPKGQLISRQNFRAVTSPKKQPKHTQDFALRSTDLLHTHCCLTIAKTLLLMSFHSIWSKCTKVIFFPMSPLVQEKVHFVCLSFSKI